MTNAVVFITQRKGKVLAVSRKDDHNDFGLPGGKIESGETPYDAVKREVLEETGLEAYNLYFIMEHKNRETSVVVYGGEVRGELNTSEPHVVNWVSWDVLVKGTFGEFNQKLYDHLNDS